VTVRLRDFERSDTETVHGVIGATIDACYSAHYPPRAVEFFKRFHSPDAIARRADAGVFLVAEDRGAIVATGALVDGEIATVFVLPAVQGRGVGAALMDELERVALSSGLDSVELDVSLPSRGFYERRGYRVLESRSIAVGGGQTLDYWRAVKRLSEDASRPGSAATDSEQFDGLLAEAVSREFSGWDFSFMDGHWREDPPSWDYRALALDRLRRATSLLDMGTGGGELLASLAPLPPHTFATEGYEPNLPLARRRLEPLGVRVEPPLRSGRLPFPDGRFDLVINRHEAYLPAEVRRVLRPGGRFLTQQVGGQDNIRLNKLLGAAGRREYHDWDLIRAVRELEEAGLRVVDAREEFPETVFADVGAIVYYLKAIPWQIDGFSVDAYRAPLAELHRAIQANGELVVTSHRFLIEAER
jgi:SAM-dependent methyltransferase/GNAT superfamily N-acetyltransferase